MDCSLPGSSVHGICQARVREWAAIASSNAWEWKVKVKSLSSVWLFATTSLENTLQDYSLTFNTPTFSFYGYLHTAWDYICGFVLFSPFLSVAVNMKNNHLRSPTATPLSRFTEPHMTSPYAFTHCLVSVSQCRESLGVPSRPTRNTSQTQGSSCPLNRLESGTAGDRKAQHINPTRFLPLRLPWAVLVTEYLLRDTALPSCVSHEAQ